MFRSWRVIRLSLLLTVLCSLYISFLVWRQYAFEKALQVLSFGFDDLPPDYANAMKHAELPTGDDHYNDSLLPQPDHE